MEQALLTFVELEYLILVNLGDETIGQIVFDKTDETDGKYEWFFSPTVYCLSWMYTADDLRAITSMVDSLNSCSPDGELHA